MDPDNNCCSGTYIVRDILTASNQVEDVDSVLVIVNGDGSVAEVFASELMWEHYANETQEQP